MHYVLSWLIIQLLLVTVKKESLQGYKKSTIMMVLFFMLFMIAASLAVKTPKGEDYYLAAVVEYSPLPGNNTVMDNAQNYVEIIHKAAPQADIIVFPEVGILLYDRYQTFIELKNTSIAPADDIYAHPVLRLISGAARNQSIYVVINVHEKYEEASSKIKHYNTNVVFNRTGHIISWYRKFHLFDEPLDTTPSAEIVTFETDFGVNFGTFICFDILFRDPALELVNELNITDIVYPTFWYSSLPFLTAVQTQAGWAYATDTNFLASGGNKVSDSNTGSGIFAGKKGPVVYLQSQRNKTAILYAKVFKKGRDGTSTGSITVIDQGPLGELLLWEDPIVNMLESDLITPQSYNSSSFKKLTDPDDPSKYVVFLNDNIERKTCRGNFCCSFKINVTFTFQPTKISSVSLNPYQYRLAAFSGTTSYNGMYEGVELCGIISCLNNTLGSCGKRLSNETVPISLKTNAYGDIILYSTVFHSVSIETQNLTKSDFSMPSLLELNDNPDVFGSLMSASQYSFDTRGSIGKLEFSSDKLITGSIYGRVMTSGSYDTLSSIVFWLVSTLLILLHHLDSI